jgi:cyclophilin family peptidyl-prolyl cis-trans isomerase
MNTTVGNLVMDVHFDWAPLGSAQFVSLVLAGFYDDTFVFRVVPGFVAQFGLNSDPSIQSSYSSMTLQDDPPSSVSNSIGTLAFASHGPNSRSTQVFFSLMDNARLDSMGFTPFAKLTDESLPTALKFYSDYGEKVDQHRMQQEGGAFLQSEFPLLDKIIKAVVAA